jgi:hypothetical protein
MPVRPVGTGAATALAKAVAGRTAHALDRTNRHPHTTRLRSHHLQTRAHQDVIATDLGLGKLDAAGSHRSIAKVHNQADLIRRLGTDIEWGETQNERQDKAQKAQYDRQTLTFHRHPLEDSRYARHPAMPRSTKYDRYFAVTGR